MAEELKTNQVQETQTNDIQTSTPSAPEAPESMADYAAELEESYKAFDEHRSQTYVPEGSPDAENGRNCARCRQTKL